MRRCVCLVSGLSLRGIAHVGILALLTAGVDNKKKILFVTPHAVVTHPMLSSRALSHFNSTQLGGTPKRQISRATDILLSPTKSTLPRYRAYLHARNRFFSAFPPNGRFVRIYTPSDNLLCGLYAIVISFQHQHPSLSPSPTLDDLLSVCQSCGFDNEGNLSGDQLSLVFSTWGAKTVFDDNDDDGGKAKRRRCQLGYLSRYNGPGWEEEARKGEDVPVMMGTREVETGEEKDDILRLWVWNDGGWAGGGMGHWEGIRRVDEGEEGAS